MNVVVDECGIVWEEQSTGIFNQVIGLGNIIQCSRVGNMNLLLDDNNDLYWRYVGNRGSNTFKKIATNIKFVRIAGLTVTSINDEVLMVTERGELSSNTTTYIDDGFVTSPNNIPPERFSIGIIPKDISLPIDGDTVIIVKSASTNIYRSIRILINISDNIIYGINTTPDRKLPYIHRVIKGGEVKVNRDITKLLCWGLNTSLIMNNSTQLLDRQSHQRIERRMKSNVKISTLIPIIMVYAHITSEYELLEIPHDSIMIRYINDGKGREYVIDLSNRYVIDYRYTPTMKLLPSNNSIGFLSGSTIYSEDKIASISYGWKSLLTSKYMPNNQVEGRDKIWIRHKNKVDYYRSYSNRIAIGIFNNSVYCRYSSLYKIAIPDDTIDGIYEGVIRYGKIADLTPYSGHNISSYSDVDRTIRQSLFNQVNPFNIAEAVLSIIKSEHRSLINKLVRQLNNRDLLLDIGGGRGGNLKQWELFNRVITVEPNVENYKELLARVNGRSSIIPINTNGQDINAIINMINSIDRTTVDVVMMNDVLTFFHGEDLVKLCNNIQSITTEGSVFLFKVMDGNRVRELLRQHGTRDGNARSFRYGSFSITHVDGSDAITFSNSGIVGDNQVEYLFDVNMLKRLMSGWRSTEVHRIELGSTVTNMGELINELYVYGVWIR